MRMKSKNEASVPEAGARSGTIHGPTMRDFHVGAETSFYALLPAETRARAVRFENAAADASAICSSLFGKEQARIADRQCSAARVRQLEGGPFDRPQVGEDHPAMRQARQELEAADAELREIKERQ